MSINSLRGTVALTAGILLCLVAAGTARAANPDDRLLRAYQPVTYLDPVEQFRPASIQSFVADADLERFEAGSWMLVEPDPEPGELPGPGTGVWRLNQDSCSPTFLLGGLQCYSEAGREDDGASVVYGRVARPAGAIVLQYWFFYYDNTYSYEYPPSDFIWQAHEGDWEVVNVVLAEDEQPLYVGYSQHCLGQRRAWELTERFGTHPIVHVGVGSHANYLSAGSHPINLACIPPAAIGFLRAHGLPLPVDRAFDGGEIAGPREAGGTFTHVRVIEDGHPSWVPFQGFWGELQYFHGPSPIGTVLLGTSPQGPAYHPVWTNPLTTLASWPTG